MGAPRDDLRLLSTFHWVVAGLAALFSLFPLLHLTVGVLMLQGRFDGRNGPPEMIGWIFVVMAAIFITAGLSYAALLAYAGRCLARARRWTYVLVMAALSCAFFPFGTVLGVFTIIVISKPEVKALFQAQPPASGATVQV